MLEICIESSIMKMDSVKFDSLNKGSFLTVPGCEEYDNPYDCIKGAAMYE